MKSDGTAVAFGKNSQGQCDVPALAAGLTCTQAAAGKLPHGPSEERWRGSPPTKVLEARTFLATTGRGASENDGKRRGKALARLLVRIFALVIIQALEAKLM